MVRLFKGITTFVAPIVIVVLLLVLLISPFMMKIWKVGEGRELALKKDSLTSELFQWQSKSATLQLSIEELSRYERLEVYAVDSFGLKPPNHKEVLVVERKKDGELVVEDKKEILQFLENLMGEEQ